MLRTAALCALCLLLFVPTRGMSGVQINPKSERPTDPSATPTPTPEEIRMRHNMQKQLTKERYEQMRKDAQQLLKLATELKQYVDNAGEHTLSLDVLKKTDEIERLSKDIRNKMKSD